MLVCRYCSGASVSLCVGLTHALLFCIQIVPPWWASLSAPLCTSTQTQRLARRRYARTAAPQYGFSLFFEEARHARHESHACRSVSPVCFVFSGVPPAPSGVPTTASGTVARPKMVFPQVVSWAVCEHHMCPHGVETNCGYGATPTSDG